MPRVARIIEIGSPHHITQRGNYRQKIFEKKKDYYKYLRWLKEYSNEYGMKIISYCLMSNHVHFIAVPEKKSSFALALNLTHMRYAQYKNKEHNVCGHLWQGRFYSSILDDEHLVNAVRYVERNPVRAGIVEKAWNYEWSSAKKRVNNETSDINLLTNEFMEKSIKGKWMEYLDENDEEAYMKELRRRTLMGRPFVEIEVLRGLEKKYNLRLEALPCGRPRKLPKN